MATPGLCGPRRPPRPLRGGGPALAAAAVGLALVLGGLGGRPPSVATLGTTAALVAAAPPARASHGPPAPPAGIAVGRSTGLQQRPSFPHPWEALRPRHGELPQQPAFPIRTALPPAHGPGENGESMPTPGSARLLEPVGVAIITAAARAPATLLWVAVVALLGCLRLLAPSPLRLLGVGVGGRRYSGGRATQPSSSSLWCVLATVPLPQDSAGPDTSPTTSSLLVDVGGAEHDAPLCMPSAELQRHLTNGFAIDVRKVVRRYPHMARYPVERVERITSYLVGLELDVRRVVEMQPALLAGQVERYEAVVELLRSNGVDVPNAINSNPSILTRRVDTLRHIMAAIAACGHSVADVVDRLPNILRCTPSDVAAMLQLHCRSKAATQDRPASGQSPPSPTSSSRLEAADPRVAVLASLGLDTDRLLRRAPQIVTLSLNKMKDILAYLQGLGVNVPRVVWKTPFVLAYLPETLQRRVQFLAENGLDVVRHVNGCPQVLALDVEGKLRPKLTFVVEEMRRSALELDRAYNLWSYSLEGRLRPRFRYLRSLDLSPGHLSTFSSFSDVRFAAWLAGTDLRHYYAWRERNGYPVPPTSLAPTVAPHDLPALPPSVPTTASTMRL